MLLLMRRSITGVLAAVHVNQEELDLSKTWSGETGSMAHKKTQPDRMHMKTQIRIWKDWAIL